MHLAHERIVDLMAGERNSFESKRVDACRGLSGRRGGVAEWHQRESDLALRIDIEQAIHRIVNEASTRL